MSRLASNAQVRRIARDRKGLLVHRPRGSNEVHTGQVTPFLDYDVEIRKLLCSTYAIESLNACDRRAVSVRGHFPT